MEETKRIVFYKEGEVFTNEIVIDFGQVSPQPKKRVAKPKSPKKAKRDKSKR